jgi:hypothetical protein
MTLGQSLKTKAGIVLSKNILAGRLAYQQAVLSILTVPNDLDTLIIFYFNIACTHLLHFLHLSFGTNM